MGFGEGDKRAGRPWLTLPSQQDAGQGERAEGRPGEQTQQREPVLGEGLQSRHGIFKVGMEGRDCEYEMESRRAVLV